MSGYPKGFYGFLTTAGLLLLATGILLVPTLLEMRLEWSMPWRLPTDWRTLAAAVHLIAAFLVIAVAGSLWTVHMQRGWRMKRNRITGSLLVAILVALGLTGAGIYYFGDETLSKWSSLGHTAAGLIVGLIVWWHMTHGKKRNKT